MKQLSRLATVAICAAIAGAAVADTPPPTSSMAMSATTRDAKHAKSAKAVKPTEMTCEEFLSYDEVTRPEIVFLSEGLKGKAKAKDTVVDVDRIHTLVPVLIEDCKNEPKASFWQKLKSRF